MLLIIGIYVLYVTMERIDKNKFNNDFELLLGRILGNFLGKLF